MAEGDPKLTREVELPRPKSSGAAVVLVATMAMFTAVGASAFVVRARCGQARTPCSTRAKAQVTPPRSDVVQEFRAARKDGQLERALQIYAKLPSESRAAAELAVEREAVAHAYLEGQYNALHEEILRGDCAAAQLRLAHVQSLVPEPMVPVGMGECFERKAAASSSEPRR